MNVKDDATIEEILTKWTTEQLAIGSKVIVHPDPPPPPQPSIKSSSQSIDSSANDDSENSSYRFVPLQLDKNQILGGVDVSFAPPSSSSKQTEKNENTITTQNDEKDDNTNNEAIAVYVLIQNEKVIVENNLVFQLTLPYIPSFLAMRELDPIQQLIQSTEQPQEEEQLNDEENNASDAKEVLPKQNQLKGTSPMSCTTKSIPVADVILVDGNGIMHERCAGVATCLGVTMNRKTIGVSKTIYCVDGLTKDGVSVGIENSLRDFLSWVTSQSCNFDLNEYKDDGGRLPLVICQKPICADAENNNIQKSKNNDASSNNLPSMTELVKELSKYSSGFAIPLQGKSGKTWGAALLGHGGNKNTKGVGTKVPIYISVGHNVCLLDAVRICVEVSMARIPEPVRQADLRGREWMRNKYSTMKT